MDGRLTDATAAATEPAVMSGAEILWELLAREGVDVVFGYPGGAILPAYDALVGRPDIHHVLVRHEQSAAHMADGFARASGRVGVAIATSGPGATNLVTGLATAMMDSVPIVCITGQVPGAVLGTDAFQETDVLGITTPITKHNRLVRRAEDIAPAIREAFGIARAGRPGPVLLDITKDAQLGRCALVDPGRYRPPRPPLPTATEADLHAAAELLAAADRPLILVGHGVIQAGASALVAQIAETVDAAIASTLLGLGASPASDPRHLGMIGLHGMPWANRAIQRADVILAVGMRFDDRVTGRPDTFAPHARIIHCELDHAEIGKIIRADVALAGDARDLLGRLLPRLARRTCPAWHAELAAGREADLTRDIVARDPDAMLAGPVLHALWRLTGGEALVVTDVGQHQMWEAQYYRHERPRSLITSGGLGTMGFALPAAIGARLSGRTDEIWVIVGDGGFQMTAAELSTIAQEGVRIHVAILNNATLGMVRQLQDVYCDRRRIATPMHNPDFVLLARAHGLAARRVASHHDLADAVAEARACPGTMVLEICVHPDEMVYPMVPAGKALDQMIRRPAQEPA